MECRKDFGQRNAARSDVFELVTSSVEIHFHIGVIVPFVQIDTVDHIGTKTLPP